MGIKGRRVHMIEEMSETIISFQRGKKKSMKMHDVFFLLYNMYDISSNRLLNLLPLLTYKIESINNNFLKLRQNLASTKANYTYFKN